MNYTLSKVAIFAGGAIIGSVATWQILKTRYEQRLQQEIDDVKEYYARRAAEGYFNDKHVDLVENESEKDDAPPVKPAESSIRDYAKTLSELNYTDYSSRGKNGSGEVADVKKPHVIRPEEFDELRDEGYETESLTYYADGVLADDTDEPIDDVDAVVGEDSLTHFGEYEDDSVFVRNDKLKTDFEILLDMRNYSDVINKSPHLAED